LPDHDWTGADQQDFVKLVIPRICARADSKRNHANVTRDSSTQYPDFYNARIDNRPAHEVIADEKWLKEEFIATVQQRGAAVIKARGLSSAGSAANAVVDTVCSLTNDTPGNDWHSVVVCSDGSYDVEAGLISSSRFACAAENGKSCRAFR
jgi:malate dehydrogenase